MIDNIDEDLKQSKLKRIDGHYISHEIQHLFHLEKGFLYTVKELFIRPGKTVRTYLLMNRDKLMKPVVFVIFCSVIFTLVAHYLHIEYKYFSTNDIEELKKQKITARGIGEWLNKNIGYTNLIIGLFTSLWLKLLFWKSKFNLYEIIILMCYLLGEMMLFSTLIIFLVKFLKENSLILNPILGSILNNGILVYVIWGAGQFFGEKKVLNYLKSIIAIALGFFTYRLFLLLIGFGYKYYDVFFK